MVVEWTVVIKRQQVHKINLPGGAGQINQREILLAGRQGGSKDVSWSCGVKLIAKFPQESDEIGAVLRTPGELPVDVEAVKDARHSIDGDGRLLKEAGIKNGGQAGGVAEITVDVRVDAVCDKRPAAGGRG